MKKIIVAGSVLIMSGLVATTVFADGTNNNSNNQVEQRVNVPEIEREINSNSRMMDNRENRMMNRSNDTNSCCYYNN